MSPEELQDSDHRGPKRPGGEAWALLKEPQGIKGSLKQESDIMARGVLESFLTIQSRMGQGR